MFLIQWVILMPYQESLGIDDEFFQNSWNMEGYVLLTISLPVWLYFSISDSSSKKGSFGKRWMKLQVLNIRNSAKLSFGQSFIRTILKLLPWEIAHIGVIFPVPLYYSEIPELRWLTVLGLVLFFVYFIGIVLDAQSRTLYDQLLGTQVKGQA
jgi:uncharacterized RDD family membrane protein YckC